MGELVDQREPVAAEASDGTLPSISVVICAYTMRRWDRLCAAVESCRRQTYPAHEVLVVVDHDDELAERASAELADGAVTVLASDRAPGLAGARNCGVHHATGDVVAFLDDDAAAEPGWLRLLAEAYADPGVVGVGGGIEPDWESGRPSWFPDELAWTVGCTYPGYGGGQVRNLIGANMSYRRAVLERLGFAEGVGQVGTSMMRCDDTDFGVRLAAEHGGGLRIVPAAIVHHHVPAERANVRYVVTRCFTEGRAKRRLVDDHGASAVLGPERRHAMTTVPLGVVRAAGESVRRRTGEPLSRAAASVGGLATAAAGYAWESTHLTVRRRWPTGQWSRT
ncbi:MAG: glycosyltransferase family 2 protein [Actinomycetota bacterium]|nr:glycosyltransferase family 2 protein [Actinomycetota bacterium]